ncbi:GNAT family N-acetyltransferase [uncultured Algibacter sp.]|uniref:GNAT family N-acetyltransferase n=1 Tax=uncultured Algibacter sp. TaxID=298659 RepID=UPI0026364DAD|nr:GNAT family N-acetyltransferase [uncultured Algibacter sp.]
MYNLKFQTNKNVIDINNYNSILDKFEKSSVFYSLQYCNYTKEKCLSYFLLTKNNSPLVLLPIYLNKIESKAINSEEDYFDVISPYGYSGPLINNDASIEDIKVFWTKVDNWYKNNNVVTEFIRFNLDNNHINYSGHLIPTLNNVKGKIDDFDSIWNNFKQKVRNNYRKASNSELTFKIYDKTKTPNLIQDFYDIYIKTMVRNDAARNYFYPKNYFLDLVENNYDNTLLAFVYKDDTPISAELIICNNGELYSYLGGTLQDYFNYRPNDFLKIEVIKWSLKNNKTHYILGGGRSNNDGLYQYKKAFFPKEEDAVFYTGRKVINENIYNKLIRDIKIEYTSVENLISNSKNYFPIYKKMNNTSPKSFSVITNKEEWQKALQKANNYDFYHTYDYHELSKQDNEKAILIVYKEDDKEIFLPLIIRQIPETTYFDATSVYGYAGPLQKNIDHTFDNANFIKNLNNFFKQEKIVSVFSRLNPFIKNQKVVLNGLGEINNLGNIVNIDLTKDVGEQRTIFSKTTKRYLNKCRKLCDFKISEKSEDINMFIDLYYENMDRVNAQKKYYFSKQYFYDFINSSDYKTEVLFALDKESGDIISAAMMVKTNSIIQYHISGTKNDYLNLSPIRLLIDEMRLKGSEENYTYFNLGGGLGNNEDELFRFKSSFSKDFKPFHVWKHIAMPDEYRNLVIEKECNDSDADFFPQYRYKENFITL